MRKCLVVTLSIAAFTSCEKKTSESAAADAPESKSVAAAPKGNYKPVDLCSLVTQAEAEAVLNKKLAPPQKQSGGDCWYMREGGKDFGDVEFILSIIYAPVRNAQEFDAFVAEQAKTMNDNVKAQGVAATPFEAKRAPDVGAPAWFIDPGLYVFKDGKILAVGLGGSAGVALAKIAVGRMS